MTPSPTMHLRFVERKQIVDRNSTYSVSAVRVLQQFWEHPDGKDGVGGMFKMKMGTWRDVPLGEES